MSRPLPAARPLSRAYGWLLRAYPAPFRARFGGEMALVFSDCCQAAWRSGGPAGLACVLGRTVLDVLASAPSLWVECLEEAMGGDRFRRGTGLWLADHGLAVGGLALLVLGATGWWVAWPLGWMALGLAFFAWVAEWNGIPRPRPGRAVIATCGCWETPLAFTVRRRNAVLLFARDEEPGGGGWSETYTVRQRPGGPRVDAPWELPLAPRSHWSLLGRIPVARLRFEHHERVSYVTRASLEDSLASAAV